MRTVTIQQSPDAGGSTSSREGGIIASLKREARSALCCCGGQQRATYNTRYARNFISMLNSTDIPEDDISKLVTVFVPKVVEQDALAVAAAKRTGQVRFGLLSLGGLLMCVSLLRDNTIVAESPIAADCMFWASIIAILANTWLGHMATSLQLSEKATLYMTSVVLFKTLGQCFVNRTGMYHEGMFSTPGAASAQFWQDFTALELQVSEEEVKILSGKGQIDGQHARLVAAMNEPSTLMRNMPRVGGAVMKDARPGSRAEVDAADALASAAATGMVATARSARSTARRVAPPAVFAQQFAADTTDAGGDAFGLGATPGAGLRAAARQGAGRAADEARWSLQESALAGTAGVARAAVLQEGVRAGFTALASAARGGAGILQDGTRTAAAAAQDVARESAAAVQDASRASLAAAQDASRGVAAAQSGMLSGLGGAISDSLRAGAEGLDHVAAHFSAEQVGGPTAV